MPNDAAVLDGPRPVLLPPRRLGSLLSSARAGAGRTIEDLVDLSGGRFTRSQLASIERGTVEVDDLDMASLALLYGVETTSLVPARSHLIVDLEEGLVDVDGRSERVRPAAPRSEVLDSYLSLVYAMRQAEPGSKITLRAEDLDVLGRALDLGVRRVEADLVALMADADGHLSWRSRLLQRRILVPAAGILVAGCAVGALLLVQDGAAVRPTGAPAPRGIVTPTTDAAPAASVGPSIAPVVAAPQIGGAIVQERNADGTPGPVTERGGESGSGAGSDAVTGAGSDAVAGVGGDVRIIDPLVVERPAPGAEPTPGPAGINPPTT